MKKALITGASSGLGYETAKILQSKNIEVINLSRTKSDFEDIKVDLSDDEDINNAISMIKEKHSDFDTLILNAGIMPLADTGKIDFDIDKVFKVNITGTIKLVNKLFELIKENNVDIVIVGSTASFKVASEHSVYCATKHAIDGFIKSLQNELKQTKSRVIGFHPGGFQSNLRGGIIKEGYMKPEYLADLMIKLLELPKSLEISKIIINRKT